MTDQENGGVDPGVLAALSRRSVPIVDVDPESGADDDPGPGLAAVAGAAADADVIGLGEATHGTREFFRVRDRLVRHLVEERGVRLFALEANFSAVRAVDEYVAGGEGTAAGALDTEGIHAPYRTESMADLVEWVRSFNEGRDDGDRVRVHGLDVQHPAPAVERLSGYAESVAPSALAAVEDELDLLRAGRPDFGDEGDVRDHLDARRAVVGTLGAALDDAGGSGPDADRETRLARRHLRTLEQGREVFSTVLGDSPGEHVGVRDRAMFETLRWVLDHEPGDRIVVLGHNAHLVRGDYPGAVPGEVPDVPALGGHLAGAADLEYYALALETGGGSVRSRYLPDGEFRSYDLPQPPAGSVPATFAAADADRFFLDLDLPDGSPLAAYLDGGPVRHSVKGGYEDSPVHYPTSDLRSNFDGVVFLRETTATRGLAGG